MATTTTILLNRFPVDAKLIIRPRPEIPLPFAPPTPTSAYEFSSRASPYSRCHPVRFRWDPWRMLSCGSHRGEELLFTSAGQALAYARVLHAGDLKLSIEVLCANSCRAAEEMAKGVRAPGWEAFEEVAYDDILKRIAQVTRLIHILRQNPSRQFVDQSPGAPGNLVGEALGRMKAGLR